MSDYMIITDSTVDLPEDFLEELGVPYMPLNYIINGETYEDRSGLSGKEFFDAIRGGAMPTTSQINPEQANRILKPYLEEGKDILYIGFSSGLSGSCNSVRIAMEELADEYPERKMTAVDSLCASMGEGFLLYKAVQLQREGRTMDEVTTWVEENKLHVCHNVTIDDLFHLHRGGRVSKASAVVGSMIKIKPIIHMDNEGKLQVIGKERGRKKALNTIVDMAVQQAEGWENDLIMVTHGDCEEDAQYVANLAKEKLGAKKTLVHCIGTVIGSHTGPGVIGLFFMGNKR